MNRRYVDTPVDVHLEGTRGSFGFLVMRRFLKRLSEAYGKSCIFLPRKITLVH